MEETHVDILVRIGLAILDAPVPIALMGFCCLRIHFNRFAIIDRCVTLPHRCQVTLVERALARRPILLRLTIRMLEQALSARATLRVKHPFPADGIRAVARPLAIRVGILARISIAPTGLPFFAHSRSPVVDWLRLCGSNTRSRVTRGCRRGVSTIRRKTVSVAILRQALQRSGPVSPAPTVTLSLEE